MDRIWANFHSILSLIFAGQLMSPFRELHSRSTNANLLKHGVASAEPFLKLRYPPYTEEAYQILTGGSRLKIPEA